MAAGQNEVQSSDSNERDNNGVQVANAPDTTLPPMKNLSIDNTLKGAEKRDDVDGARETSSEGSTTEGGF